MTDFAAYYEGQAAPSSFACINDNLYTTADRPRGHAVVDRDGYRWFYRVPRQRAGAFRKWVAALFLANDGRNYLAGRYPFYEVRNRPQR